MTLQQELVIENVDMQFGGLRALNDVSFSAAPGEVTALIGPNGAGKTTTVNIISGAQRPTSGGVVIDGTDVTRRRADQRRQVARTFQIAQVFTGLTVLENVMVGLHRRAGYGLLRGMLGGRGVRHDEMELAAEARRLLGELGIDHLADRDARALPLGQERLLEMARALATRPDVLLLDEVASGLTPTERDGMAERVKGLRDAGLAVLVVEHNMRFVREVADKLVVLNFGEVLYSGPVAEGLADQQVVDAYLGTAHNEEGEADVAL